MNNDTKPNKKKNNLMDEKSFCGHIKIERCHKNRRRTIAIRKKWLFHSNDPLQFNSWNSYQKNWNDSPFVESKTLYCDRNCKKKKQKLCVVNVPMCDNEWFTNWLINFYVSFTLTTIWSFFTTSSNHKKQKQKNYPNQNSIEQYKAQVNVGDCQGPER